MFCQETAADRKGSKKSSSSLGPCTACVTLIGVMVLCAVTITVIVVVYQRSLEDQQAMVRTEEGSGGSGGEQHNVNQGRASSDDEIVMAFSSPCDGPGKRECTRFDIWTRCFLPLVDLSPKDGFVTADEIAVFYDEHLRFYERWLAPKPSEIVGSCDHPTGKKNVKGNGRVDWKVFNATRSSGCLGLASRICMVRDVCDRELKKMNMPLTVPVK